MGKYFKFPRVFRINRINGFTFGPSSFTFQYLRKQICKKSECLRINEIEYTRNLEKFSKPYDPEDGALSFEERGEARLKYESLYNGVNFFHPWNCISLHVENATVDFAVKDKAQCFALIHVLNHLVNKIPMDKTPGDCLTPYNRLNFKMKVSFEAWILRLPLESLFKFAI